MREAWSPVGFSKEGLLADKAPGEKYVNVLLKDHFFLSDLGCLVSMDSSILNSLGKSGCIPKPDACTVQTRKSLDQVMLFIPRLYEQVSHP